MRILVDEDLASRELISRLRNEFGDDVLEPEVGASDQAAWDRAQAERATVLTANAVDFLRLAQTARDHAGLLLVYRTNNRSTDVRAGDIARAVIAINGDFRGGIATRVLVINDFAR